MRVLVTGTEACAIDEVQRALRLRGHVVVSCTDDVGAEERCRAAVDSDGCPVSGGVDVVLAVRMHPLPHLTRKEQLVECALLTDMPLVVAGSTVLNPFGARASALVEGLDRAIDTCEQVLNVRDVTFRPWPEPRPAPMLGA
jgi:hypothetical protein